MPDVTLRDYTPADIPAIAELFRGTVHRVNSRDYSPEQVQAWAPTGLDVERWTSRLAPLNVILAERDGGLAGFASWRPDGYFDHLYTHADHQNRGVATALVREVEHRMREAGVAFAFTDASITARPFFERRGYRVVREQSVLCRGVPLTNYRMEKRFA